MNPRIAGLLSETCTRDLRFPTVERIVLYVLRDGATRFLSLTSSNTDQIYIASKRDIAYLICIIFR
jgi:hypothetical protein